MGTWTRRGDLPGHRGRRRALRARLRPDRDAAQHGGGGGRWPDPLRGRLGHRDGGPNDRDGDRPRDPDRLRLDDDRPPRGPGLRVAGRLPRHRAAGARRPAAARPPRRRRPRGVGGRAGRGDDGRPLPRGRGGDRGGDPGRASRSERGRVCSATRRRAAPRSQREVAMAKEPGSTANPSQPSPSDALRLEAEASLRIEHWRDGEHRTLAGLEALHHAVGEFERPPLGGPDRSVAGARRGGRRRARPAPPDRRGHPRAEPAAKAGADGRLRPPRGLRGRLGARAAGRRDRHRPGPLVPPDGPHDVLGPAREQSTCGTAWRRSSPAGRTTCCGRSSTTSSTEYYPVFDRIEDAVDALEDRIVSRPDHDTLEQLFGLKRQLVELRHVSSPQREVFNQLTNRTLPFIDAGARRLLPRHLRPRRPPLGRVRLVPGARRRRPSTSISRRSTTTCR